MTRRALVLPVALALALAGTGCASAREKNLPDVMSPDIRIRVWHNDRACCANPLIGTLFSYDADSIRVRLPTQTEPIALSRASIDHMESARRAGRAGVGSLTGFGVGTVAGAILGYSTSCSHCDGDWRGLGMIVGAAGGALYGTIAGAITGLVIRRDIWDPVRQ